MADQGAGSARMTDLDQARHRQQLSYRAIRLLALALIGFVVVSSFQLRPGVGGHGPALGVAVALTGLCGATIAAMLLAEARAAVLLPVLLVAVACGAALTGLQSGGPGFLGVFPAVCLAGQVLPVRVSVAVAAAALAAVSAAYVSGGRVPLVGIMLNDFGVLAFYLLSLFTRRLSESNHRAEVLLAELEQTRAAQATAAALAERQRLAREMHDVLAHSLSGLVLNLEGARLLAGLNGADPRLAEALGRAQRLARAGLLEARRAIGMLRDDALPGPERLADLAAEFAADTGVPCEVTVTGAERDMGTDGRLTLYRVAQEALTNVRKHAQADHVRISVAYEAGGTRLVVDDTNGRAGVAECGGGEAPGGAAERLAAAEGGGYGLTGMRERAELLGGALTTGATGAGYRVELWVPA